MLAQLRAQCPGAVLAIAAASPLQQPGELFRKHPARTAGVSGSVQAAARGAAQFQGNRWAICLAE
jgi:hypothetical protein